MNSFPMLLDIEGVARSGEQKRIVSPRASEQAGGRQRENPAGANRRGEGLRPSSRNKEGLDGDASLIPRAGKEKPRRLPGGAKVCFFKSERRERSTRRRACRQRA